MKKKSQTAKAAPLAGGPVQAPDAAVAERAYLLWEGEGRPAGAELRHWLQAEEEVGRERGLHSTALREHEVGIP